MSTQDEALNASESMEVVEKVPVVRKGPPQRVSSTPRARFAMMNAMNTSTASTGSVSTSSTVDRVEKPREQAYKPKKVDPLKDKYRDRAEERRQRLAEDETEETALLDAEALRERRERSKYLGGSEETTHLVEGLDIMLYERRKLEIELEEQKKREKEVQGSDTVLLGTKQLVIDQYGHAKAVDAPQDFKTMRGRGVYNALFQREARPNISSFLPGRTTYSFNIDAENTRELPMIIERNMLSDAESYEDRDILFSPFSAQIAPVALRKLSVAMSYLKQGDSGIKKRKQEREEQERRAKEVVKETLSNLIKPTEKAVPKPEINEDDEDIFGDVGDVEYTPTTTSTSSKGDVLEKSQPSAIQSAWDAVRSEETDGRKGSDTSAKRLRTDMTQPAKEEAMERDEPFDDYDGFESGSDGEDMFAMDTGVKLKRGDFATDEEWIKYMQTREAIPKSAFQFGVKAGDGRRKQQRGKSKKQQLYHSMYKSTSGSIGFDPNSASQ